MSEPGHRLHQRAFHHAKIRRELVIGIFCAFLAMSVLGYFALNYWPGDPHHCAVVYNQFGPTNAAQDPHQCFCENFDLEKVKAGAWGVRQHANTWSNLFPLLIGLILAWKSGADRASGRLVESSRARPWGGGYPLIMTLIVGFMAPGSMYFHASLTEWGGWTDSMSMYMFVYFLFVYGVLVRRSKKEHSGLYFRFFVLFVLGVGASMFVLVMTDLYVKGYGLLLLWPAVVFAVSELVQWFIYRRDARWFWAALVAQGLALVIWRASVDNGRPLCIGDDVFGPESWLQAHGLWHVLANIVALFLFLHFRSERDRP